MTKISFGDGKAYEQLIGAWSRVAGQSFLDWLAPKSGMRWLDVGCGNGAFTELIVERCGPSEVQDLDPAEGQLAFARTRYTAEVAHYQAGRAESLPFGDRTFDAVVTGLVISSYPNRRKPSQRWRGWCDRAALYRPSPGISPAKDFRSK